MNCLCELSHFHLDINSAYSVLHIDVHYVLNLRLNVQFDTEAGDNNMRTASGVMSRRVSLAERARESGSDRKCGSMEQSARRHRRHNGKSFLFLIRSSNCVVVVKLVCQVLMLKAQ